MHRTQQAHSRNRKKGYYQFSTAISNTRIERGAFRDCRFYRPTRRCYFDDHHYVEEVDVISVHEDINTNQQGTWEDTDYDDLEDYPSEEDMATLSKKRKHPQQEPKPTKFYAVLAGHQTGIFMNYSECADSVTGFKNAQCMPKVQRSPLSAMLTLP